MLLKLNKWKVNTIVSVHRYIQMNKSIIIGADEPGEVRGEGGEGCTSGKDLMSIIIIWHSWFIQSFRHQLYLGAKALVMDTTDNYPGWEKESRKQTLSLAQTTEHTMYNYERWGVESWINLYLHKLSQLWFMSRSFMSSELSTSRESLAAQLARKRSVVFVQSPMVPQTTGVGEALATDRTTEPLLSRVGRVHVLLNIHGTLHHIRIP